ncbi:MAG: hypothetical protein K9I26_06775 [Flavobacterium sp.]|nr:hypothetical protein [Flavobacterium sp.]
MPLSNFSKIKKGEIFTFPKKTKEYQYEGKTRMYDRWGEFKGWGYAYTSLDDISDNKQTMTDREIEIDDYKPSKRSKKSLNGTNDFFIVKDSVTKMPSDQSRIYYTVEGTYKGHYFFATTDTSNHLGFRNDGVNKSVVSKLDVWLGGHPVGRNSVKGKGLHVSSDYIAGYFNKWDVKPIGKQNQEIVNEIISELDNKYSPKK